MEYDHASRATTVIVVCVVFAAISSSLLLLRLYLRCRVLKAAGLDDGTMVVAQMLAIAVSVTTILETKYGLGRHVDGVSSEYRIAQLNYLYINSILYNLTMNVIKISFLLQYDRIFHSDRIRAVCFGMMIYVVVWAVVQGVLLGLACMPLALVLPSTKQWCLPTLPVWYLSSAMNIATDAAIFGIPLPSVIRLQLPRQQKAVILAIFCLGFCVCALSAARVLTLHRAADPRDPSWDNTDATLWSVVEMNGAILVSSVPTLRPLFARQVREIKSTLSRSRSQSKSRTTLTRSRSHSHSRSRSVSTRIDEEAVPIPELPKLTELHLVDLEELARRGHSRMHSRTKSEASHSYATTSHSRQISDTRPRTAPRPPRPARPRPDTGVFVPVKHSSIEGFDELLAQMNRLTEDMPSRGRELVQTGRGGQSPIGPLPTIIVTREASVRGSGQTVWP